MARIFRAAIFETARLKAARLRATILNWPTRIATALVSHGRALRRSVFRRRQIAAAGWSTGTPTTAATAAATETSATTTTGFLGAVIAAIIAAIVPASKVLTGAGVAAARRIT